MPYPHTCYQCGKDLGGSYTSYFGNYCHTECHPDTIEAKQTAERHYQRGKVDAQAEIARLTTERDTARAETAAIVEDCARSCEMSAFGDGHHFAYTIRAIPVPAHATAALAARDKATREAALREAREAVKKAIMAHDGVKHWTLEDLVDQVDMRILALIDKQPPAAALREAHPAQQVKALEAGRNFLIKCQSAWAAGEPGHKVKPMLDAADAFAEALSALSGEAQP